MPAIDNALNNNCEKVTNLICIWEEYFVLYNFNTSGFTHDQNMAQYRNFATSFVK